MATVGNPRISSEGVRTRYGAPGGNIPGTSTEVKQLIDSNRFRSMKLTERLIAAAETLVEEAENLTQFDGDSPLTAKQQHAKRVAGAEHILARLDSPLVRALIDAKETGDKFRPDHAATEAETTDRVLAMRVMHALAKGLDAAEREARTINVTPNE